MSSREHKPSKAANRYRFLLYPMLLGAVICSSPGWVSSSNAQQAATATLRGRVVDPNGSVVSGAQVIARHKATGVKRTTTTNDEGIFVISNLAAGDYEVRAQAQGFAERLFPLVTLQVGQISALDIPVQVNIKETVTIDRDFGAENPIDTSTSVVNGVISKRDIETLPLNGRNFLELALLIPGNSPAPNFDPTKSSDQYRDQKRH